MANYTPMVVRIQSLPEPRSESHITYIVPVRKPTNELTRSAAKGIFCAYSDLHISCLRPIG